MPKIPCNQCKREFATAGGLDLHIKMFHSETSSKAKTKDKPKSIKKTNKPKATPKQEKPEEHPVPKNRKRTKANFTDGTTVSQSEVTKALGGPLATARLVFSPGTFFVRDLKEKTYSVKIESFEVNEWNRVTLTGKKFVITWTEGPVNGKHRVSPATVRKVK